MRHLWVPLLLCLACPVSAQQPDTTYFTRAFLRMTTRLAADTSLPADLRSRMAELDLDSLDVALFARLDDSAAVTLMRAFSATLAHVTEEVCAAFVGLSPELAGAGFEHAVHGLDSATTDTWVEVFERALRSQADTGVELRIASETETQAAVVGIVGRLESADRQRMMAAVVAPNSADRCWAARVLFNGLAGLPAGEAGPLVRAMFHEGAPESKAVPPTPPRR